jgi:hypothetical protein
VATCAVAVSPLPPSAHDPLLPMPSTLLPSLLPAAVMPSLPQLPVPLPMPLFPLGLPLSPPAIDSLSLTAIPVSPKPTLVMPASPPPAPLPSFAPAALAPSLPAHIPLQWPPPAPDDPLAMPDEEVCCLMRKGPTPMVAHATATPLAKM